MNLLRNAIKTHRPIVLSPQNQRFSLNFHGGSARAFSTEEAEKTPKPFLQTPDTGLVYGRLFGITKRTTKSDILTLLEGCNVSADDVKVGHNRLFNPSAMMIQFHSQQDYEAANRALNRRGRFYRLDRSDRSQWDYFIPYDGKAILLQGIPRTAQIDDIERFLSGCAYDPSTIQMIARKPDPDSEPIRMAIVRFPSHTKAAYAFLKKNREFCLNEQISVRVLE